MNKTGFHAWAWFSVAVLFVAQTASGKVYAQDISNRRLAEAAELIQAFTANDDDAIPAELLQRARGIAVIPNVFRGGFILGGRRGRGVLAVRQNNGVWSNPAFVTLTGGSIGWQIGAESTDLVLIFANDNAVKNIASGKFTLGGDATAVAGPLGRHATIAVTFRAEVYGYARSQGLFAGAAFEGARLDIDEATNESFYIDPRAQALRDQTDATPANARRFLLALEQVSGPPRPAEQHDGREAEEAATFPLGE